MKTRYDVTTESYLNGAYADRTADDAIELARAVGYGCLSASAYGTHVGWNPHRTTAATRVAVEAGFITVERGVGIRLASGWARRRP